MGDVSCVNNVCEEKFKNFDEKIEEIKLNMGKLETKVSENERNLDKIDNALSMKLVQLEAKFEIYSKINSDKIDTFARDVKENTEKVEKKIDMFSETNNKPQQQDSFKEWLQKFGLKMFEMGIYAGIIYAILSSKFK